MEVALKRDENMFVATETGVGGGDVPTPIDHSQFARLTVDDTPHDHKSHTNAWKTNNLNPNQPPPQPLMMLQPQSMNHQKQNVYQKDYKTMGGFSPIGGKTQQGRGDGGYNKDIGQLSWEQRLRKAQGAKDRLERAEGGRVEGSRQFGVETNGGAAYGPPREDGPPRGRGGGGRGRGRGGWNDNGKPRMSRREDITENCGGFGVQIADSTVSENCGGFGSIANNNNELTEKRGGFGAGKMNEYADNENRGGFSARPNFVEKRGGFGDRSFVHRDRGHQGENRRGGWKGGPPPPQAQKGEAGAFPMMSFGMQRAQRGRGGGGWRGGMHGHGGFRGGLGGGVSNMQMQMRGAAAAAESGAPHPMMMRGPMGTGFPLVPSSPSAPMGLSPMHQHDDRFRPSWHDANMSPLPTLMDMSGPVMTHQSMGGGFGGHRGGFSSYRGGRGARGEYRGRGYNRDRETDRGGWGERLEATGDGEIMYEMTHVYSPTEEMAAYEEEYQE